MSRGKSTPSKSTNGFPTCAGNNVNLRFWTKARLAAPVPPPVVLSPVLFLDVDGVLHAHQRGTLDLLPLLEEFLRAHPGIRVVISSTWRMQNSLEDLREFFAADVRHQIEGVTPFINQTPFSRFQELEAYLLECGPRTWCALDDEAHLFPPGCPNLVHTKAGLGLTPDDLEAVARLLLA
jgi:hypothetical protein